MPAVTGRNRGLPGQECQWSGTHDSDDVRVILDAQARKARSLSRRQRPRQFVRQTIRRGRNFEAPSAGGPPAA